MDVEERIACAKAIKEIMIQTGKTAFVVDHDLLLMSYLADSVILTWNILKKKKKYDEIFVGEERFGKVLERLSFIHKAKVSYY